MNLFELQTLCVFKMHHSKPHQQFSTLSDFIWSFSGIHSYFWAKWPWKLTSTTNDLWKGWKLAWYHHFTHIACAKKLRGLRQKLDALRVQNGQSLSKYQGFGRKLICYKGISLFWTYLNSRLFVCSKCTIQSHISNFQPFLTSFGLFRAFTHIFELNDHENWQALQMISEKVESWHGIIISPT